MIDPNEKILNAISHSGETKAKVYLSLKMVVSDIAFKFWDRFLENNRSILYLLDPGFINEAIAIQQLSIENFAYAVASPLGKPGLPHSNIITIEFPRYCAWRAFRGWRILVLAYPPTIQFTPKGFLLVGP